MRKFLLSLIGLFAFILTANAVTYTHTFKDGDLTTEKGTKKFTEVEWSFPKANTIDWSKNGKGIQIGSKNDCCTSYSLSTSAFKDYTITSVTVYTSIATSGKTKLSIKAGNTPSEQFTLTTTNTGYTLNCKEQGDIVISWTSEDRAYYVSKIEVTYELPSDQVNVEEPKFKTPEGVYENDVRVTVETDDKSLVLYYTMDGTTPSYEDYQNETGSTECSKYYVMYFKDTKLITETTTIKVLAVKVDGESVYKSDIVEATYVVSPTKPYTPAKEIATGNKYAFVANDSVADFLYGETTGYLQSRKPSGVYNKYIETVEYSAFTFTSTNGGYTIQDAENRYMYLAGTDGKISFAAEKPATGAVWSVSIDNNGKATIKNGNSTVYYSANNDVFGCYETAEADMVLPSLYMKREYPQATITPEDGSTVQGLKEFTITCNEGIAVSEDFSLKAEGNQREDKTFEIDQTYECTQVDKNTLKFTIKNELKSVDNIQINIKIKGKIYLNPDGMNYPMPIINKWENNICSYTHKGEDTEPAKLLSVTPEDKSTLEELSHFVFTFSKIGTSKSEAAELQPRLYAEGLSWNHILGESPTNSDGEMIAQAQLALKTSEPLLGNGTYFLEIPTGYFIDRNGNNIEGITLKYTVTNDSGLPTDIEDIIEENNWTVYNINGVKVLETTNANDLNKLAKGVYIINGNKVIVK